MNLKLYSKNLYTKYRNNNDDMDLFITKTINKKTGAICEECLNEYLNSFELNTGKFHEFLGNC